jgi:hypothetical protein
MISGGSPLIRGKANPIACLIVKAVGDRIKHKRPATWAAAMGSVGASGAPNASFDYSHTLQSASNVQISCHAILAGSQNRKNSQAPRTGL